MTKKWAFPASRTGTVRRALRQTAKEEKQIPIITAAAVHFPAASLPGIREGLCMIIFQDISKIYCIGSEKVCALNHANLHIYPGEFVSIIGPSGSGKSTMMNIMGCLDTADKGQYLLDGLSVKDCTEQELTRQCARKQSASCDHIR